MNVLVDTSLWSLALRRRKEALSPAEENHCRNLRELISEGRVAMIGPIRQELLSGIPVFSHYRRLREYLEPFEDLPLTSAVYEKAAEFFNLCRRNGIQGTHIDFLICAAAVNYRLLIFTVDGDFLPYARHLPLRFFSPAP
jgi:predicted nucleic acid-binding protein